MKLTTIVCFSKAHSFIPSNLYTASASIKIFSDRLLLVSGWQGIQFRSSPAYSQKSVRYQTHHAPKFRRYKPLRGNELVWYQRSKYQSHFKFAAGTTEFTNFQPTDYKTKVILSTPALSVLLKRKTKHFLF